MVMMLTEVPPLAEAAHPSKTNEGTYDCNSGEG
jgi:hypothetical protein